MGKRLTQLSGRRKPFPVKLSDEELDHLRMARVILKVSMAEIIRYATFRVYLPSVLKKGHKKPPDSE